MDVKARKIDNIQLEVKDFHPVLKSIFAGMKEIVNIDYKQGNREFGTDFVLSKVDDLIGDMEYIGVIAKVTSITQSDREVDRQIEECAIMPRTVCGNKKIHITEIWVITTKNISQNAQDFFSEKYKSSKIKFIDSAKLTKLIDKYFPEFWNDVPIQIGKHLIKIQERVENIEKNSSFYISNSKKFTITQDLIKIDNDDYEKENNRHNQKFRNQRIDIHKVCAKTGTTLIEGQMGSGKSYLLRKTALFYSDVTNFNEYKIIPIYLSLKDLEQNHDGLLSTLIDASLDGFKVDNSVKILVLIDGIDESKKSIEDKLLIIKDLSNQASSISNIKLILAGRDINIVSKGDNVLKNINRYRISPLSMKQVLQLIENSCTNLNIKNRIANDLSKSNLFKMLPKTPIAAVLLTKLLQDNSSEIPSNLTELYSKYTELSLGRWDLQKGLQSEKEYESARKIIINISEYLLDNDLYCISIQEAQNFFIEYLGERNLGINPIELFNTVVNRSDLVSIDLDNNTFSFKHRSFAEFFYACGYSSKEYNFKEENFDIFWGTVTFFWVGLLKDCPTVIDKLSSLPMTSDRTQILKILNMGNLLLAAHQTPYKHITLGIKNIFLEMATYFHDIKHKNKKSGLAGLPEMQLLCLFRHIASENYGYDYFKDAIYEIMIDIEDDLTISNETRSYMLFLLNTCALSFEKKEDIFESMIEKIGKDNIPLNVQLAIKHESDQLGLANTGIMKIFRSIRKLAKDRSIQSIIKNMYEKPLKRLTVR